MSLLLICTNNPKCYNKAIFYTKGDSFERTQTKFHEKKSCYCSAAARGSKYYHGFRDGMAVKKAMLTLIQQRMLDISNSAADMLDGDSMKTLRPDDVGKDGNFTFSVDLTVEDPGEFGAPIVKTEALVQASKNSPMKMNGENSILPIVRFMTRILMALGLWLALFIFRA